MCGIFGYIGPADAVTKVLEGIAKLEYRGYDSAGFAALVDGQLVSLKRAGKVAELLDAVKEHRYNCSLAISHTRWATHGKPSELNAHPHFDQAKKLTLVHNGIIENYQALREQLEKKGVAFASDTDTEVISQLIGYHYKENLLEAVQKTLPLLKGAFAIAVIHENHPDQMICCAKESPLAIGLGQGETFVASDPGAFAKYTKRVVFLYESEIALVTNHSFEVFDQSQERIEKEWEDLSGEAAEVSKGGFAHYMLKEIYEQPQTILNAILSRYSEEYGTAIFEELAQAEKFLLGVKRIVVIACGTAWHAGLIGGYMIEERAGIPVQVEISSEFRYKNPIVEKNTLGIAISQSGETADTLAAIRELKRKGARVIGVCNVQGSSMSREVDHCLFLRAGPEIAVAATKSFTSKLAVLFLLMLRLARMRSMNQQEGSRLIESINRLPSQIKEVLAMEGRIKEIAKKYAPYNNFFFLGRRLMYPTALESALKLKECAYVNANGYPAGEMKHGPIALIDENCPTVAFTADSTTYEKILSNLMEVKARNGRVLAIAEEGSIGIEAIVDDVIFVPKTTEELAPVLSTVVGQLFGYYVAFYRGTEIDQPRNLAKSVTVE
ncbi:MAG: glutamine--fructose-6-phosphate transaminase (isomerizing) [Chlamydiia bacterium]|nr:glutamine--fructose-6-phosphate transaminase (isomerizing) [Chlamydiia bacterium]